MRFRINHLFAAIIMVAIFLGLRSWWISCEDDDIVGYASLMIGIIGGLYAGWNQVSRIAIASSSALCGFAASTLFALELVFHSPSSMFYRHRIAEMYYDDPVLNVIGILLVTIFSGLLGLLFGWAVSRCRSWIVVNKTELFTIGVVALGSAGIGWTAHAIGIGGSILRGRFVYSTIAIGLLFLIAWVHTYRSFPR